jgi:hypothetical protein
MVQCALDRAEFVRAKTGPEAVSGSSADQGRVGRAIETPLDPPKQALFSFGAGKYHTPVLEASDANAVIRGFEVFPANLPCGPGRGHYPSTTHSLPDLASSFV